MHTQTQTIRGYLEQHLGKISDKVYNSAMNALARDSQQCLNYNRILSNKQHFELLQTNIEFFRKHLRTD